MEKKHLWPFILFALLIFNAILFGALLGKGLATTVNTRNTENFTSFETSLPTKLLDVNGELITEYASDEKREIIALGDLPQHMIDALISREDRVFYSHHGYTVKSIMRAVVGKLTGKTLGGGSTLTQQIAGTLYCDRTDISYSRKLKELWWAIQMERRYSKDQILELYLNKIYFGGGTYGVNAASKYYFGHPATEITPAEAALLVVQLSNPAEFNPFEHPNAVLPRQQNVLDTMVANGYLTQEEAEESFDDYWANFDYTRTGTSAYDLRDDQAPWFSEYVRRQLADMTYGSEDIYTSGYTVNTSLNLTHQKAAEEIMQDYIAYANRTYQSQISSRQNNAFRTYIPLSELLSLVFNLPSLKLSQQRSESLAMSAYTSEVNPVIDIMSLLCGMETLKTSIVSKGNLLIKQRAKKTTIEGTMIALENGTGRIDALVGGSQYDSENQFIRAVQSKLQPGSTFKPLYYSAAIDSRKYTMTTIISDTPRVFRNEDGTPYIPENFKGEWEGDVQVWYALAHSMNVPSIQVLEGIGFDAAINRASRLLGISQADLASRGFVRSYTLGLGVCSVRPIELAQAFATFPNAGKEVTPIAILSIEDKNGNVIRNLEKELRDEQRAKGEAIQLISEETAYIMTQMLTETVQSGTLQYGSGYESTRYTIHKDKGSGNKFRFYNMNGDAFIMPAAGKTGTTQNWADAWTVGFTPYYTAAFWFGFDTPGQSLGLQITGSTLAGVAWGDFMHVANDGKPYKSFPTMPETVTKLDVCSVSGGLWTEACGRSNLHTAYYLPGTAPTAACKRHQEGGFSTTAKVRIKETNTLSGGSFPIDYQPIEMPDLSFLNSKIPSSELNSNEEDEEEEEFEPTGNWLFD
ncbi:MAG: PBP1A family penicillin-binding protein [Treponema sp.]|nr:PBP1A family penicillin-binding protein [Treponema sp.]